MNPAVAQQAGELLAAIHRETAGRLELKERFGDRTVFDELRVDPFYRHIIGKHPHVAPQVKRVIDEVLSLSVCVVHADFSPKNLLLSEGRLILVDYETGHLGDPAFDLGFFLSHLLLKTIKHAETPAPFLNLARLFWETYWKHLEPPGSAPSDLFDPKELERRTMGNLGGCLLARIDGKSPIDYFDQPWQSETARKLAFTYLMQPATRIAHALEELEKILARRPGLR